MYVHIHRTIYAAKPPPTYVKYDMKYVCGMKVSIAVSMNMSTGVSKKCLVYDNTNCCEYEHIYFELNN